MKKVYLLLMATVVLFSCKTKPTNETDTATSNETNSTENTKMEKTDAMYAHIKTSKGEIICELEFEKTPITVANFIGLAEGLIENKAKPLGTPYYNGLLFHRVIPNFMIQGGDPQGTGTGGPGYQFQDEIDPSLIFSGPGILAMANAGPGTNGSQFFITHVATDWLNGKHTIFGHVTSGQDVVNKIAQGDKIESITIDRVGDKAKAFDAKAIFAGAAAAAKKGDDFDGWVKENYPTAKKVGDMYIVETKKGSGPKPSNGQNITAHYTGKLKDGKKFDSSVDRGQPFQFKLGEHRVIQGWELGFANMHVGSKATLLIPYSLGYGDQGYPGAIPPKATLIFDVELIAAQ